MKQIEELKKYKYQINDTCGIVEAVNIRLAIMKAVYEYQDAWPIRVNEEDYNITIKPI